MRTLAPRSRSNNGEPSTQWTDGDSSADVFNADLWTDVVGIWPSNGSVWVGESTLRPIEGYCWPLSASPGETIQFMVSGDGPSQAVIQRCTSTSSIVDTVDVMTVDFDAVAQPVPATAVRSGCGWGETFSLTIPDGWTSGLYAASCTEQGGASFDITFVVKPAPSPPFERRRSGERQHMARLQRLGRRIEVLRASGDELPAADARRLSDREKPT